MDLDDISYAEGMAISCMPPAAEYFQDPMWYDSGGRDPLKQREIFKLEAGEERTRRLKGIVKEYRLYGPMLYELAAEAGRVDIIRLLLELGANPNLDRSNAGGDDDAGSTASADEEVNQEESSMSSPNADVDEADGDGKQSASGEVEALDGDDDAIKSDEGSTQDQDDADD
jgi:hypothetical protein